MSVPEGFAVWITGLPASGKSSITRALVSDLNELGITAVVLESDEMRKILTPGPTYTEEERTRFYSILVGIAEQIIRSGNNIIFDATANKRSFREEARTRIPKFIEVFVDTPLEICRKRDPKGLYARAAADREVALPGIHASYEPPLNPEIRIPGDEPPEKGAERILQELKRSLYI